MLHLTISTPVFLQSSIFASGGYFIYFLLQGLCKTTYVQYVFVEKDGQMVRKHTSDKKKKDEKAPNKIRMSINLLLNYL